MPSAVRYHIMIAIRERCGGGREMRAHCETAFGAETLALFKFAKDGATLAVLNDARLGVFVCVFDRTPLSEANKITIKSVRACP